MSRHKGYIGVLGFALLVLGSVAPVYGQGEAVVDVSTPAPVSIGNSFTVAVDISNVLNLYSWQLDFSFDPTVLAANTSGPTEGSFLSGSGSTFFIAGTVDNGSGTVSNNADTLLTAIPGASGSGTLADFYFSALNSGTSPLTLQNVILLDASGNVIPDSIVDGSISVQKGETSVPEPGTLELLALALVLWGVALRRKRRSALLSDERLGPP